MYKVFTFMFEDDARQVSKYLSLRGIDFLRNTDGDGRVVCVSDSDLRFLTDLAVSFDLPFSSLIGCNSISEEFAPSKLP